MTTDGELGSTDGGGAPAIQASANPPHHDRERERARLSELREVVGDGGSRDHTFDAGATAKRGASGEGRVWQPPLRGG